MSYYQELNPAAEGRDPQAQAEGPPAVAGALGAAAVTLLICGVMIVMWALGEEGDSMHVAVGIGGIGSALMAWAARTVIVLLWRIARAAETKLKP
jgi:hypothetical protein